MRGEKNVIDKKQADELKRRYERLVARLAQLGPIVQGTITERTITKKDPRNPDTPKTIGPYYQWTFKRNAKTVTINLSAAQVKPFQRAIDNNRKLEIALTQMRELSCQILEATTHGVQRRKTNK
jgi:hypothetical protein